MKKLYLVDVSSMFFRAFYAVRPLSSPSGVPVNAIYGFLTMIVKLLKQEKPDHLVFCYDRKEPSFRLGMYDQYKANRSEMPEDLAKQIPYIKKSAELLGIPALEVPQYEADDIIGTLTKLGRKNNFEVVIVSGDKDFGQLIEPGVILYDTMKDIRYDSALVKEKWGVTPAQMIDYQAIVGDSSDNIPGVPGLGPKGAIKLLEKFSSLEDIYARIDEVEGKSVKEKLVQNEVLAKLSKQLVTIVTNVPVDQNMDSYRLKPIDKEAMRAYLQDLNFKSLERSLLGDVENGLSHEASAASPTAPAVTPEPQTFSESKSSLIEKVLSLDEFVQWLKSKSTLWGLRTDRGYGFSDKKEVVIVSAEASELSNSINTFEIRWSGYDLKNFWHGLKIEKPQALWDNMIGAYVLRSADCSDWRKTFTHLTGEALPEFLSFSEEFQIQFRLETLIQERLESISGKKIVDELDMPLISILYKMENRGIQLDSELLKAQSIQLEKEISVLEESIQMQAKMPFNVASPKQLSQVLFEQLGLPPGKKTKTGFSTDNEVLEGLDHPIAKMVLSYRELAKLKSTYVDALPALVDGNGRLHTQFNQALTTTGRLSSVSPNLQNIPVRTQRGQDVRKAFIASSGNKLLSADYSQIELRVLAHISGDPGLARAFKDDLDIHSATASEIYGVSLAEVTPEHRRMAKAVNFGIAYGQGAFGLAETLGIPRGEASEIIDRYFKRFSKVKEYIDSTIQFAHEHQYVQTLSGRRRYIPELADKNQMLKKFGERAAINAPIQGTASDLVKMAMIEIERKLNTRMLLQVHDELIFEGAEAELKELAPQIIQIMENVMSLSVPLKVNYSIGNNWDEVH